MFYELLNRKFRNANPLKHDYKILAFKDVADGEVLKREAYVERVNTSESLNSYKVSDFKLQNIIAVGAFDMLKPQTMSDTNPLTVISDFESRVSKSLEGVEK